MPPTSYGFQSSSSVHGRKLGGRVLVGGEGYGDSLIRRGHIPVRNLPASVPGGLGRNSGAAYVNPGSRILGVVAGSIHC